MTMHVDLSIFLLHTKLFSIRKKSRVVKKQKKKEYLDFGSFRYGKNTMARNKGKFLNETRRFSEILVECLRIFSSPNYTEYLTFE